MVLMVMVIYNFIMIELMNNYRYVELSHLLVLILNITDKMR
jgi:hypothetical protein